jgi:hypothetical protein
VPCLTTASGLPQWGQEIETMNHYTINADGSNATFQALPCLIIAFLRTQLFLVAREVPVGLARV